MKSKPIFLFLVFSLLAATSFATTQPAPLIEPKTGPAAFGHGEFNFNGDLISFSFDAHGNEKNHARGRAVFDNLTTQTEVVVKIDCLKIVSFDALMTGTVLHSNDPDFPKLTNVIFAAEDGRGIRPDIMTPLFISPFPDCNDAAPPLTMFEVEEIVVQP